jgi:heavy metal translocating P-type ATPase
VGTFLAMNVMMISLLLYTGELQDLGAQNVRFFRWALLGLSLPAMAILGTPFAVGMVREVRRGRPSLDSLVALGAAAALGVSALHVVVGGPVYFDTATMLPALMTVGRLLEASSKARTVHLLKGLLADQPVEARLLRGAEEVTVPAEGVRVGDVLRVRPGERFPVDGRLLTGQTHVHEAQFTGEAQPRAAGPGSQVLGGSVNGEGAVTLEAEGVGEDALMSRIARSVEEAAASRGPVERMVERTAAVFVPLVAAAALGSLAYWAVRGDLVRGGMGALAVLVVACPCALGLATPLVTSLAIGRAAREGVLIRSGETLERLPQVTRLFLDKTGTLTRGSLVALRLTGSEEALAWVATLESAAEHPVGRAILDEARRRGLQLGEVRDYRAVPGQGAVGTVALGGEIREVLAGRPEWLESAGFRVPGTPADGLTHVCAASRGEASQEVACLTLADQLRPEAAPTVGALQGLGLQLTVLSGDRAEAASALVTPLGLTDVVAPCLPDDKVRLLREARVAGACVAMCGDGLNDAPALAEADVGIALGGGAELAREAGQVTILGDDLRRLPWLVRLSREARRTIRANLGWAFGYNCLAVGAAFLGYLHPLVAVLAMLGSSAFILRNSLRIGRFAPPAEGGEC